MGTGQTRKFALVGQIRLAIGECRDMDRCDPRKPPQYVMRANLVPPVGWKGQSMRQKENFATHPSPRAMNGPSRLVTASGKRLHSAIRAAWRWLVGSASRTACPGAVQLA